MEDDGRQFVFDTEPLRGVNVKGAPPLLQVTVHHLEPQSAALRRAVEALPVSTRQREV